MERQFKKIVFSDLLSDVSGSDGTLFIATNPKTRAYLMKKGIPARDTLGYFQEASRVNALEKSRALTGWLEEKIDFFAEKNGITDAYKNWLIFLTRFSINYCLWSIEIVLNAIDMHQPEEIGASHPAPRPAHNSVYIEAEDGCLARLTNIIARQKNLRYGGMVTGLEARNRPSAASYILKNMAFRLWGMWALARKTFFKKTFTILFTTKLYKMDRLAIELQNQIDTGSACFLRGPIIPSFELPGFLVNMLWRRHSGKIMGQKAFYRELAGLIKKEKALFSYRGVPFADLIAQKFQDNIAPYVAGQLLWSFELERFIDLLKPRAILLNGDRTDDLLLAEIASKKNVTTIFISHGSYICPKNEYEHLEWGEHGRAFLRGPYSYHVLQSPLAEGYLKAFLASGKAVKAGPLIWGMPVDLERSRVLFKKMFEGKYDLGDIKVILHAGTSKASSVLRFHIYETPDEYVQALRDLAEAVEKMPDTVLVIKFRPTTEIGIDDLKAFIPFSGKVILSVDEPFLDTLGMSDLLVSFSSTTIEEALQNRIPVLLYGGSGRYQHVRASEVNKSTPFKRSAAYHVKDPSDLEYALGVILGDPRARFEEGLFAPYIYDLSDRASVADLIKNA